MYLPHDLRPTTNRRFEGFLPSLIDVLKEEVLFYDDVHNHYQDPNYLPEDELLEEFKEKYVIQIWILKNLNWDPNPF